METSNFKVDGMHCGSCVHRVETAIQQVPGVQSTNVSLKDSAATITYDRSVTNLTELGQAVAAAGYTLSIDHAPLPEGAPSGHCGSSSSKNKGGCCCS